MLQRTALYTWEDCRVEECGHLLDLTLRRSLAPRIIEVLTHKDDTTTRTAQRLVRRGGDDMSELDRVVEETCSDEPSGVSHIDEEDSPDLICDLTDTLVVPFARVS